MPHLARCSAATAAAVAVALTMLASRPGVADAHYDRDEGSYSLFDIFDWMSQDLLHLSRRECRSIDGTGNNLAHPQWGSAGVSLLKKCPAPAPVVDPPGARYVSNVLSHDDSASGGTGRKRPNKMHASDMLWQWGQFIDHDVVLTGHHPNETMDITIPTGDIHFDPDGAGGATMGFSRSDYIIDDSGDRRVGNHITSYIDGSNVYGSHPHRTKELRSFVGGKLETSDDEGLHLPFNANGLPNAPHATLGTFHLAGDIRANEHWGLLAMHTLWMREHNTVCDALAAVHTEWDDETLFQTARKLVIAEMQHITYEEFLPMVLGYKHGLDWYEGYDHTCDAGVADEFATAAYRMGHSLISDKLMMMDNPRSYTPAHLFEAFFSPATMPPIDKIFRGLSAQLSNDLDVVMVDSLRNMLFEGTPAAGHGGMGMDLAALNLQRGRDHGLGTFTEIRAAYGLAPIQSFADVTDDVVLAQNLETVYGTVERCDAWVGMLAERPMKFAMAGETMAAVLREQFDRLRRCDRFWYQNDEFGLPWKVMGMVEKVTLADVIRRNTGVGYEMTQHCMAEPFMFEGEVLEGLYHPGAWRD